MDKPWVDIIVGSKSDRKYTEDGIRVLEFCGVAHAFSVLSAHRHKERLVKHCKQIISQGASSVIAGAGWSAGLPGTVAAETMYSLHVFGVAISSDEFPDATDAMLSIVRMPGGCPVLFTGIGSAGFENAAIAACQGIAGGGDKVATTVKEKVAAYVKNRAERAEPIDALEEKQKE